MGKPGAVYIVSAGGEHYAFHLEVAAMTVAEANDTECFEAAWIDEVSGYARALQLVA